MTTVMEARWAEGDMDRVYAFPVTPDDIDLTIKVITKGLERHYLDVPLDRVTWSTYEKEDSHDDAE